MEIEINYEEIKDKSKIENADSNVHYQWCLVTDKHNLNEMRKIGFAPITDENINCPYAEKQKDGTWMRKEFGEALQLWGCPMEIYKRIRQQQKKERELRSKPAMNNKQQGVGVSFQTEYGTGKLGLGQALAQK